MSRYPDERDRALAREIGRYVPDPTPPPFDPGWIHFGRDSFRIASATRVSPPKKAWGESKEWIAYGPGDQVLGRTKSEDVAKALIRCLENPTHNRARDLRRLVAVHWQRCASGAADEDGGWIRALAPSETARFDSVECGACHRCLDNADVVTHKIPGQWIVRRSTRFACDCPAPRRFEYFMIWDRDW